MRLWCTDVARPLTPEQRDLVAGTGSRAAEAHSRPLGAPEVGVLKVHANEQRR